MTPRQAMGIESNDCCISSEDRRQSTLVMITESDLHEDVCEPLAHIYVDFPACGLLLCTQTPYSTFQKQLPVPVITSRDRET